MLAIGIVALVFVSTFVGCNERLEGNVKAGFFVALVLALVAIFLLGWLFS